MENVEASLVGQGKQIWRMVIERDRNMLANLVHCRENIEELIFLVSESGGGWLSEIRYSRMLSGQNVVRGALQHVQHIQIFPGNIDLQRGAFEPSNNRVFSLGDP